MLTKTKTRGPWTLTTRLRTSMAIWQSSRSCTMLHIYSLSTPEVEIELFFPSNSSGFWDTADFQNCHIWAWNLAIGQSARSCTKSLSFYPNGSNLSLYFCSKGSGFWDIGRFSKLPYLGMKLGDSFGQSSRSCTFTLFLPQGIEIELIFALRAAVSELRANFQNCHIWAI